MICFSTLFQLLWTKSKYEHIHRRDIICHTNCNLGSCLVCTFDWEYAGMCPWHFLLCAFSIYNLMWQFITWKLCLTRIADVFVPYQILLINALHFWKFFLEYTITWLFCWKCLGLWAFSCLFDFLLFSLFQILDYWCLIILWPKNLRSLWPLNLLLKVIRMNTYMELPKI